jgi:hypothetical protein
MTRDKESFNRLYSRLNLAEEKTNEIKDMSIEITNLNYWPKSTKSKNRASKSFGEINSLGQMYFKSQKEEKMREEIIVDF